MSPSVESTLIYILNNCSFFFLTTFMKIKHDGETKLTYAVSVRNGDEQLRERKTRWSYGDSTFYLFNFRLYCAMCPCVCRAGHLDESRIMTLKRYSSTIEHSVVLSLELRRITAKIFFHLCTL